MAGILIHLASTPSGPDAHLTFKSEITLRISEGNIFLKEEERVGLLTEVLR